MWLWLKRLADRVVEWWHPTPKAPEQAPEPCPEPVAEASPEPSQAPPEPDRPTDGWPGFQTLEEMAEEAARWARIYERRRRKHDVFVKPQGTPPTPKPRGKRGKKEKALPGLGAPLHPSAHNANSIGGGYYVNKHHKDIQDVMYMESEDYGEFSFRDTILEQLERYHWYIRRLKKADKDTYDLYSQYGATILPYVAVDSVDRKAVYAQERNPNAPMPELPPWFDATRPTFGCFARLKTPGIQGASRPGMR